MEAAEVARNQQAAHEISGLADEVDQSAKYASREDQETKNENRYAYGPMTFINSIDKYNNRPKSQKMFRKGSRNLNRNKFDLWYSQNNDERLNGKVNKMGKRKLSRKENKKFGK